MYLKAIIATLVAWFVGLLIDVNLGSGDWQILCLRGLLPVLAMGALYPQRTEKEVRNGEPF